MVVHVEDHVRIHLDEAAVGIIGETLVAGAARQRLDRPVGQAEIEDGIHHARHRGPRPRTHRDQERIVLVPEDMSGDLPGLRERGGDRGFELGRIGLAVIVEIGTDLGRYGEPRRDGKAEIGHFRQVGAFAPQQIAHLARAFGRAITEFVDPFRHRSSSSRAADGGPGRALSGGKALCCRDRHIMSARAISNAKPDPVNGKTFGDKTFGDKTCGGRRSRAPWQRGRQDEAPCFSGWAWTSHDHFKDNPKEQVTRQRCLLSRRAGSTRADRCRWCCRNAASSFYTCRLRCRMRRNSLFSGLVCREFRLNSTHCSSVLFPLRWVQP